MALKLGKEAGTGQRIDNRFEEDSSIDVRVELGLLLGTWDQSQNLKCGEEEVKGRGIQGQEAEKPGRGKEEAR